MQLLLRRCGVSTCEASEDVRIHAWLTPEGSRAYRLNGRLVSAKELKQRLARLGVHLTSAFSLIRQEAITELADSSDPLAVSAVVAECSGLRAWVQEATAARTELELQAKDKERMQTKMDILVRQIAAARIDATLGERCAQLEAEFHEAVEQCVTEIHATKTLAQQQRMEKVTLAETLQQNHQNAVEDESRLKQKLALLHEQHADSPIHPQEGSDTDMLEKSIERAALVEEISLFRSQLEAHSGAQAVCTAAKNKQAQTEHSYSVILREIESLESALSSISEATVGVELARQAEYEASVIEAQLREACHAAAGAAAAYQHAQQQVDEARLVHQSADSNFSVNKIANIHFSPAVIAAELVQLAAASAELRCKENALAAVLQKGPHTVQNSVPKGLVSLPQCFQFKDPEVAETYGAALEVLAGQRLSICVAKTAKEAAHLVASGQARGLRIWSYDAISVPDRLQIHRQVAAAFPPGSVIVPIDLLEFDANYQGVIARAFGPHLIVSSMEVGRAVLERYGMSSISLDGTIMSRGRLTGGWAPARQHARGPLHSKIRCDADNKELISLRASLQRMEAEENSLRRDMAVWQNHLSAREAAECAASDLQKFEEEQSICHENVTQKNRAVERLQVEYSMRQEVAKTLAQGAQNCGIGQSGANQAEALRAKTDQLRQDALLLENKLGVAAAEAQAAEATLAGLDSPDDVEGALKALEDRLKLIDAELLRLNEANAQQRNELQSKRREVVAQCELELAAIIQAQKAASTELKLLANQIARVDALVEELTSTEIGIGISHKAEAGTGIESASAALYNDLDEMTVAVRKSVAKYNQLKKELSCCKSRGVSAGSALANHHTAAVAEKRLEVLRQNTDTIQCGAQRLEEGLQAIDPHAEQCNECIFDSVRMFFCHLIQQALPGMEIEVIRNGGPVHIDGAAFRYRRQGEEDWVHGLEALSGGQRTLVSLAFMVAARAVGGGTSSSSVLLADEVDAALDSVNQEQAARLLRLLCTCSTGESPTQSNRANGTANASEHRPALAQVLCISHSPIFQQLCDKVIKLRRSVGGTVLG